MEAKLSTILGEGPDVTITGFALDSRRVQDGDAFIALPGHHEHGAVYARQAVRAGAVVVITDEAGRALCSQLGVPVIVTDQPRAHLGSWCRALYRTGEHKLAVVGVTGTNGKTTVAHLLEAGCFAAGRTAGIIGTLGVRYPGCEEPGSRTTPEAPDLHRVLHAMVQADVDVAILEVTSHAIAEHRIDGIMFDVAGFTNLSRDHLDYHGTMERYFSTKASLFDVDRSRDAVIGIDDEWGRRLSAELKVPHRTWSIQDDHADWFGVAVAGGLSVRGPNGFNEQFALELPGTINTANATCAVAMLDALGIVPTASAFVGLKVPGRMEVISSDDGVRVIVDYAHTPAAIHEVIKSVQGAGRTTVVFGAGGDRDREKRSEMGVAALQADMIVVTDDNPRSEDPASIRSHILKGCAAAPERVREIGDRRAAIHEAVLAAEPGDTVLVLGKGHEQGQDVSGTVLPFDDRAVVAEAIDTRRRR